MAEGAINEKGVLPLETAIGENEAVFRRMMNELKEYNIVIQESIFENSTR